MNRAELEQLLEKTTKDEAVRLNALYDATENCLAAYQGDNSAARLKDWQAAEAALDQYAANLQAQYFSEETKFPNLNAVAAFLKDDGYKIGKSKLYIDRDKGLIRTEPDGSVLHSQAIAYITKAGLTRISDKNGNAEELHAKKCRSEIRKIDAQAEKVEYEMAKDMRKYILKKDVEMETAVKIAAFEAGVKHLVRTHAIDWISATGGNPKKVNILMELFSAEFNELLDAFGKMDELNISLKKQKGVSA